jgi:hypothetical protein
MKIVTEKMPELLDMSPILKEELKGDMRTNMNDDKANIEFLNGSWVKIVASNQGARSGRANLLILDEFRMIEYDVYSQALRRMKANRRHPKYLNKEEYQDYIELEKNRQIFLSSAWYKHNWSYAHFITYLEKMREDDYYSVVALPYQKSIEHGFLTERDIKEEMEEKNFSPITFSMEMECLFYGQNENSFFQLDDLENNRKIIEAIYPKDVYDDYGGRNFKPRPKDSGELRIISADIARMSGKQNDASAYTLLSLRPNSQGIYKIYVEYMETMVGGHSRIQARRIRQLYDDFDCDYIVLDISGQGSSVADRLIEPILDNERDKTYEGLKFINNEEINKSASPDAEERIFAMQATADLNKLMANNLRDYMKRGKIRYLINSNDCINYLSNIKGYFDLSLEKQAELQKPYIQIDNFVNETIALELQVTPSGVERLVEPRSARKDRYSSLTYGVHFLIEKEKELSKPQNNEDWDNFMLF